MPAHVGPAHIGIVAGSAEGAALCYRTICTEGAALLGTHAHPEVSIYGKAMPAATTTALAAQLVGRLTTPTQALQRAELQVQVQEALNSLDHVDREVLVLRHFEHLSNAEAAQVLGISKSAASKRFIVALKRLKAHLCNVPGLADRF